MALDKVQLLGDTGVTAGSYNLSSITVGADGRLTAASTPVSINLPSTANPGDGDITSAGGSDGALAIFNEAQTPGDPSNTSSRSISFWTKTYWDNTPGLRFFINQNGCESLLSLKYRGQLFGVGGGALGSSDMLVDGGSDGMFVIYNNSGAANREIALAISNETLTGPDALLRCYRSSTTGVRYVDCPYPGTNFVVNGSKSFLINHPIDDTKDLLHVAIEGPRADLLYRGYVKLVDGVATVDLDEEYGLIPGTWGALCRNPQVWVTSIDGWEPCKGHVSDQVLTIYSKDSNSEETVSWLVVAERQDPAMYNAASDENGRPILEPDKRPQPEPHPYPDFPTYPFQQVQSNSNESSSEEAAAKLP